MNETVNLMITRRSVRKFKSDMIPKEIIDEIITAGTVTLPSSMNGVLMTRGGTHPVTTIRMERYEAIIAGQ